MKKSEEQVLVIPTAVLHDAGLFQGLNRNIIHYARQLLNPEQTRFVVRSEAEDDPSFKQLIPYVVFKCCDQVFQYTRGQGMGEKRLHGSRSIGVGGHINPVDHVPWLSTPYREGMLREVSEEVIVDSKHREEAFGFINDDSTTVGQVHLGIVHVWHLDEPKVRPREADLTDAGFASIESLLGDLMSFETWSQVVLRELAGDAR